MVIPSLVFCSFAGNGDEHFLSCSLLAADEDGRQRNNVEVLFPGSRLSQPQGDGAATDHAATRESVASASSDVAAAAGSTIKDKAIAALPAVLAEMAKDTKRKARSSDPGWNYGFWPDIGKKEMVQCIFCQKVVPAGIKRFKQHLAGGFGDVGKCPRAPELVRKEMAGYLKKNARNKNLLLEDEWENVEEGEGQEDDDAREVPSSGTAGKQVKRKLAQAAIKSFMVSGPVKPQTQKQCKSVSSMLCKTPEEVVAERNNSKCSQTTLEHLTKKDKESKQIVDDHVADFLIENGIPFNVINSRSWEIMLESIGQYGPGYRSPTYHDCRGKLLDRAVGRTTELRKKHEESWKEYGCSIMSDGWTSTNHRHIINFLANSPAGTFFLGSVDASSEVANANMLADLLEQHINQVGKENVVQVVTDNGANFKAAGRILMERIPTLFWTPCAAHCLDLMLEDIGKINEFNTCINHAKKVTRFVYKHGRILDMMRGKIGGDLVRPAVTRFATSFLTLASMQKNKQGLKSLFVCDEWHNHKLAKTREGELVESIILPVPFWTKLENCL